MDGGNLIPRTTLTQICNYRRKALELYGVAHDAMEAAQAALNEANSMLHLAAPTGRNRYNNHLLPERERDAREKAMGSIKVPSRDDFMAEWRRTVDVRVWAHIVEMTDMERLMDKKAKDELQDQLVKNPPEVSEENILATLQQLMLDAGTIFKRGMANTFSALDRRFKSHDGFKIGSRVILTGAFNEHGHWSYYRNHRDTLTDIERVFLVLDGKELPPSGLTDGHHQKREDGEPEPYVRLIDAIDRARGRGFHAHQTEVDAEYFTIRIYMNGNAHVWFKRDDLVERVNKLLAEYYGEVIPDGMTPEDDGGLFTPKTALAKNYGFFPTPEDAADRLFDGFPLYRPDGEPPITLLEPSAGTGNLSRRAVGSGAIVDCIEIQPGHASALRAEGIYRRIIQSDFLAVRPDPNALYDRVLMNPPYFRGGEIDHVMHAMNFLKPGGHLAAILPAGIEFREDKKTTAFRVFMKKLNARWSDLPAGSFASVGTYCNTIILRVWKDGRRSY